MLQPCLTPLSGADAGYGDLLQGSALGPLLAAATEVSGQEGQWQGALPLAALTALCKPASSLKSVVLQNVKQMLPTLLASSVDSHPNQQMLVGVLKMLNEKRIVAGQSGMLAHGIALQLLTGVLQLTKVDYTSMLRCGQVLISARLYPSCLQLLVVFCVFQAATADILWLVFSVRPNTWREARRGWPNDVAHWHCSACMTMPMTDQQGTSASVSGAVSAFVSNKNLQTLEIYSCVKMKLANAAGWEGRCSACGSCLCPSLAGRHQQLLCRAAVETQYTSL